MWNHDATNCGARARVACGRAPSPLQFVVDVAPGATVVFQAGRAGMEAPGSCWWAPGWRCPGGRYRRPGRPCQAGTLRSAPMAVGHAGKVTSRHKGVAAVRGRGDSSVWRRAWRGKAESRGSCEQGGVKKARISCWVWALTGALTLVRLAVAGVFVPRGQSVHLGVLTVSE